MLEFPQELYLKIANFIQWVIYHPLLWQDLSDSTKIPDELMIDETTIELGKFIMMGENNYFLDPAPVRMYGEQRIIVPKENIKTLALDRFQKLNQLFEIKNKTKEIAINAEYRGIDVVLVQYVKQWGKIICCEPNEYLMSRLKEYFIDSNIVYNIDNCKGWQYKNDF
jgi:hypothetical protein